MDKNLKLIKNFIDSPNEKILTEFLNGFSCKKHTYCSSDCCFSSVIKPGCGIIIHGLSSACKPGHLTYLRVGTSSGTIAQADNIETFIENINLAKLWTEFTEMYYVIMTKQEKT